METFCGIGPLIVLTLQSRAQKAQMVFSQFLCQGSIVKSIIKVAVQSLASDIGVSQLAMFKGEVRRFFFICSKFLLAQN